MKSNLLKWPTWLLLLLVCGFYFAYQSWLSTTRIALVNYRDFQIARFEQSNTSGWVELVRLDKNQLDQLDEFDFVLMFGRGLALDQQQLQELNKQIDDGIPVLVSAATNPSLDLTNIQQPHLDQIKQYIANGSSANFKNLMRYIRVEIDQKNWGIEPPQAVVNIDSDVLFHTDESHIFTEVEDYLNYYKKLPGYAAGGKKIALLTSVPGPFNANRDHLDALIQGLEQRGHRVFPVASQTRRLELLKTINPDAVIMMPHGRLHLGRGADAVNWLKQQQIPVLAPLSVFDEHARWLDDPQGYSGAMLTMNVVLPELDGAVAPYVINAQFKDANGYLVFKAIPDRLERFMQLLDQFIELKSKANEQKKVAIVYFRGPGKNALVAGGMEVAPSLFNTLQSLKREGYDLGGLPDSFEAFKKDLDQQGLVLAPFAKGDIERFLNEGRPALVSTQTYQQWCTSLSAKLCQAMAAEYGPIPGDYMVTGDQQLAIARLQYGNIVVMPQPLPGIGDDTFKMVHGTDKAPPYNYAGAYLWLRNVFNADAVVHYGTHGSLEFTPAKQVALSGNDWADALLGGLPHFYVYTMSNVGEAIIAKRRSYATIINHLTPPFQEAGLYSDWKLLADKVSEYSLSEGAVKRELQLQMATMLEANNFHQDLQLSPAQLRDPKAWDSTVLLPLSRWIETLSQEKITEGLYTLGKPYTQQQAESTATLMTVDALAESWLSLQRAMGTENLPERVSPKLRDQVKQWIQRRLNGESAESLLSELLPAGINERVHLWQSENPALDDMAVIRGFIAMGNASKDKPQDGGRVGAAVELGREQLMALTARVVADSQQREFIESLKGQDRFEHISRSLDPQAAKAASVLAKLIPAIAEALAMLENTDVRQLVEAMQSQANRQQVLQWLEGEQLAEQVAQAQANRLAELERAAVERLPSLMSYLNSGTPNNTAPSVHWQDLTQHLQVLTEFDQRFSSNHSVLKRLEPHIQEVYELNADGFVSLLKATTERDQRALADARRKEQQLAQSHQQLLTSIKQIGSFVDHMLGANMTEQQAALTALAGGYIEPASGGDPIVNPQALPTGRNMYSIDAEKTPTRAAWQVGRQMAEDLLASYQQEHGRYPEKVSFTLWPNSFIQSQGATVAQMFYLLGVEPVHDAFGRVQTIRLIPAEKLGRPRIDVVVQSAGQFRDIAASRLALFEKAILMAADAAKLEADSSLVNYVAKGVRDAEQYLLEQGVAPLRARTLAATRSFGGANGAYGTGIMGMVEGDSRWGDGDDVARQYIKNMGASYGDSKGWGDYEPHLFSAALLNTDVVIQPRSSNTWGALSLDHVYEFMGGLNNAVRLVTGKDPAAYFNDFRNPSRAQVSSFHETVWAEMRTTLLNPKFIAALQEGSGSSAETFAETFRNSFGWNVMKPDGIDETLWQSLYEVYIDDKHQLNLREFFEKESPYALQEMAGVMLETARRGYWQADEQQLQTLAELQFELMAEFEAGGGDFSGGNTKLTDFTAQQLSADSAKKLLRAVNSMRGSTAPTKGVVLEKQGLQAELEPPKGAADGPAKQNERERLDKQQPSESKGVEQPSAESSPDSTPQDPPPWWLLALLLVMALLVGRLLIGRRKAR